MYNIGGTLGQGANSALQDVVALDSALDETKDELSAALPLYSRRQVREGLALSALLSLPPRGLLGALYALTQTLRGLLRRVLRWGPVPTQQALSQSLVPFSSIAAQNRVWINWASRGSPVLSPLKE